MPLYEYYCRFCKYTEEVRRTFEEADKPLACPKCTKPMLRKMGNIALFKFKEKRK